MSREVPVRFREGLGVNFPRATRHRTVGGIMVPVTRRVYATDADHRKIAEPLLVSIRLRGISFDTV